MATLMTRKGAAVGFHYALFRHVDPGNGNNSFCADCINL